MRRKPGRERRNRRAETEAWKIIFAAFTASGLLVIGWTLFVLLTDHQQRTTRVGANHDETNPASAPMQPAKP